MACRVSTFYYLPKLVILAGLLTVIPTVCGNPATCDNEQRPLNEKACERQIFGQLVPYPGDCHKFLVCNCQYPTVKQCPGGLWFNDELKTCDYPQNVNCMYLEKNSSNTTSTCKAAPGMPEEICSNYEQGHLLKYPFNCNAYINCTEGCAIMNYCQADKVYNSLLKICDTPEVAECQELPLPTTATVAALTTVKPNTTLATNKPDVCLMPWRADAYICSETLSDIYQFYPYNCTAYIKCQANKPCLQYCEPGKVFNALLGICDEDIECQETAFTTTPSTTTVGVSSSLPPLVDPSLCKGEKDYTALPYAANCGRYLLCEGGEVQFKRCPDGWFFNSKLKLCDEAEDNQCSDSMATTTPTSASGGSRAHELCSNQPAGITFPYRENCQLYYYCRGNGLYYTVSCPFGNFYDPQTGNCGPDVPRQACGVQTNATILSPQEKCENEMPGVTFAYDENCSKYVFCKGKGEFVIMNCPYNNYYYANTGNCGPSSDQNICQKLMPTTAAKIPSPSHEMSICNDNYTGQLLPYPNNYEKYISCVRPIPIAFHCPSNWQFNDQQQKCVKNLTGTSTNFLNDICRGHKEGTLQVNSDNCQLYYECLQDDGYMLKACLEGKYFDPVKRNCSAHVGFDSCWHFADSTFTPATNTPPVSQVQEICQDLAVGHKVNYPHNCSKYIICEQPIPQGFRCLAGLKFSLEKQTCVEPWQSNCGTHTKPSLNGTTEIPCSTAAFNQCSNKPDFTFLPYENDCSRFIMCYRNTEHLAYCNTGEYFDKTLEKCSATASKYSCLLKVTNESTWDPCYGQPEGTKISYPNNCAKYIECHEPLNIGYDCPASLEFSVHQQQCILPELANCSTVQKTTQFTAATASSAISSPLLPPLETCENKASGSTFAYTSDCAKYYVCIRGKKTLTHCMPNSYYNPISGECDHSVSSCACKVTTTTTMPTAEATTTAAIAVQNPCSSKQNGFMFANPKNHLQYFICFEESAVKCVCPNNLIYNSQQEECEQESKTSTTEASRITQAQSTTSYSTETQTTPITAEPAKDNICCGQTHGTHLSYPGDSTKYVICQYPVPQVKACPKGKSYTANASKCM